MSEGIYSAEGNSQTGLTLQLSGGGEEATRDPRAPDLQLETFKTHAWVGDERDNSATEVPQH